MQVYLHKHFAKVLQVGSSVHREPLLEKIYHQVTRLLSFTTYEDKPDSVDQANKFNIFVKQVELEIRRTRALCFKQLCELNPDFLLKQ